MGKTKTAFVSDIAEKKTKHQSPGKVDKVHIAGLKGGQRIKVIEAEEPGQEPASTGQPLGDKTQSGQDKVKKVPRARGKKWSEAKNKIEKNKNYELKEAIKLVKESSYSKFDGTMEMHLQVKKVGTSVNVSLPYSSGKAKKIEIASDATVEKLKTGKIDFDVLIATPEIMPKLVAFARLLGPKGLMPNPKNGTLVSSLAKAKSFSGKSTTLKTEKEAPLIHTSFGKVSQKDEELIENCQSILKVLGGSKQINKAYIKATMSPAVKVALN